jgi:hypothetical protein
MLIHLVSAFEQSGRIDDSVRQGYQGVTCDQARRSTAATPDCGQRSLCFHCASVTQAEVLGAMHRARTFDLSDDFPEKRDQPKDGLRDRLPTPRCKRG